MNSRFTQDALILMSNNIQDENTDNETSESGSDPTLRPRSHDQVMWEFNTE